MWTHNDALVMQSRLQEWFYGQFPSPDTFHEFARTMDPSSTEEEHRADLMGAIHGDTYFVSGEIMEMIITAAAELPETVILQSSQIPSRTGFVLFEQSYTDIAMDSTIEEDKSACGFSFALIDYLATEQQALRISMLAYVPNGRTAFPGPTIYWIVGDPLSSLREMPGRYPITERDIGFIRVVASLLLFIDQDIVVAGRRHANRATQRKLERSKHPLEEPVVRVITLRKKRYEHHASDESERVYHHRWLVRGHWRNQWYPSLGIHQPKWIAPYIKGPDDTPLKPSRASIYAVVR